MNREMTHIHILAGEIGYRVATTEGEHRAANYIEQEFHNYCLQDIRQEPFRGSPEMMNTVLPYLLTALGSSLLAPLAPLLGLSGMLAAPATLFGEMRMNRGPVTRFTNKGTSHNVIGILPAKEECRARVVLMAHYDSVRVRSYMKPQHGKSPRRFLMPVLGLSYLTAIGSSIVGAIARRKQNKALTRSARRVSTTACAALLTTVSPFLAAHLVPGIDGEGANDNASGVAVLLSLAEQMAQARNAGDDSLRYTDVWFVATGAEETGLNGARALFERHKKELKNAYFFAIDTVGAGRLHYTIQERFLGVADVPEEVTDILVKASERGQHGALPYILRAGGTDAGAILARHSKAASISCLLPERKWPEINWPTDVRKYVDPELPPKATAFVKDILYEIDRRVSA